MSGEQNSTRREFMQASGGIATMVTVGAVPTAAETASWKSVTSPVDVTLWDVANTSRNDFAVGGGGIVVERAEQGWTTVLQSGPTSNGNSLYGADVTDDGKRLWFAGSSGVIGEYDVETGSLVDHSAPNDVTNNFNDIAVTGPKGDANVYVAGGSGSVHYSFGNGASGTWNSASVGQGNALKAIDFYGENSGHLVNGNAKVFHTTDGASWNQIGIADADVSLYGVDSDGEYDVWVAGGSGTVYRYALDDQGVPTWSSETLGQAGLRDVEIEGGEGYVAGNGGTVFDRANGQWSQDTTPTTQGLKAIVDGSNNDVAVGASGTIIETNPDAAADPGSGGGGQSGDAGRIGRVSTQTSESKSLAFTIENVGEESVTVEEFALETDVGVGTIERSGAEVTIAGDVNGSADSTGGFPVDDTLRALDTAATLDPDTSGQVEFGQYDGGNVALTVDSVTDKPASSYVGATLKYGDDTQETFYFAVTNVNS